MSQPDRYSLDQTSISDTDSQLSSRDDSISLSGYDGDDESYEKDIINFVENGIFTIPGAIPNSPQDEVPPETEQDAIEEEEINTQASQAVDNLQIEIYEEPQEALEIIDEEPQVQNIDEEPIAKRKAIRIKNVIQRYVPPVITIKPKTQKKPTTFQDSQAEVSSQIALEYLMDETKSTSSLSQQFIIKKVRLETRSPDDQAKVIYGAEFETLKNSDCYLCGFPLSERISYKHNERWGYTHNPITSSYDHTAPVNFSSIVSRIPSQYNTKKDNITKNRIEDYEKDFLKSNGKFACFHCNFTKSQMMFITCKIIDGVINFQNFNHNRRVIEKFVNDLYRNNSEWSKGSDNTNTLYKCIRKYYNGNINNWKTSRIKSIIDSANEVCTMIKEHVDEKSVMKRFYYTKLLLQKAYKQLQIDQVYLAQPTDAKKNIYLKKFIAHVVAKAEATNPNFVKPWNTRQKPKTAPFDRTKSKSTYTSERQKDKSISSIQRSTTARKQILEEKRGLEARVLPSGEFVVPTKIKTPFEKQRESDRRLSGIGGLRRRKNKRKTYRRIRLF